MPSFFYKALDRSGKTVSGQFNAVGQAEVIEMLKARALMPILIKNETKSSFNLSFLKRGISLKELAIFTRQLKVLLSASVPIDDAISLLVEQASGEFKKALIDIKESLREGKSLATSMERYPNIFSNVYVYLVRAGEASGRLEQVLGRLTESLERSDMVQNKISDAMKSPIFMLIMIFSVFLLATTFIIPAIAGTLKDLGGRMPGLTLFMLGISGIILNYWYLILSGFGIVVGSFLAWKRSSSGSLQFDKLILKIPMVSRFSKIRAVVQFSQTLGMLLEAGVNFSEALDLVSKVVANKVLSMTLVEARSNIIREGKIAKHLEKTGMFPPIAFYMIKVGEESGNLESMLLQVGKDYEEELMRTTDGLVSTINPIMTILIAAVVLIVILSIFLPIMEMNNLSQLSDI